ncbi:MAG: beta/gamma crystallin-related protein [Thermoanaerobaculia bacterium]|nr:beta/gamma crystallin-related protein [Thermoanaerobaculia bacterium]
MGTSLGSVAILTLEDAISRCGPVETSAHHFSARFLQRYLAWVEMLSKQRLEIIKLYLLHHRSFAMNTSRFRQFLLHAGALGLGFVLVTSAATPANGQSGHWYDDDQHYHDDGSVCEHHPGYHDRDSRDHRPDHRRWDDDRWNDGHAGDLRRGEGVVIFSEDRFEGRATLFTTNVRDMNGTYVGNDTASSILVAPGCKVTLYEHANYRGRSVELTYDLADLGDTRLRDDRLTSLRLNCRGGWNDDWGHGHGHGYGHDYGYGDGYGHGYGHDDGRRGRRGHGNHRALVLFEHQHFRGRSRVITGNVTDLNPFYMNDLVSSIQVPRGCEVYLYEHQNYRGKSYRLGRDITDLNRVHMNDLVSSLRLECRRR